MKIDDTLVDERRKLARDLAQALAKQMAKVDYAAEIAAGEIS
jgi:hypothetical protein